jgi:hypothetical protein
MRKGQPGDQLSDQAGAKEIKNEKLKIKNDKRTRLAGQIKPRPGRCARALPLILKLKIFFSVNESIIFVRIFVLYIVQKGMLLC